MPASSAAPAAAAAPAEAEAAEEKPKEKTIFTVKLEKIDAATKAKVIREVKVLMPNMTLVEVSGDCESETACSCFRGSWAAGLGWTVGISTRAPVDLVGILSKLGIGRTSAPAKSPNTRLLCPKPYIRHMSPLQDKS